MSVALTGLPDEEDGEDGDVVVLPGDTPLLRPGTLARLVRAHRATDAAATLLTAVLDDPTGYGRVVRGRDDAVARVVEEADATDEEREVAEVNTSMYCFKRSVLAPSLRRLSPSNAQGEYYLTDVVEVLYEAGHRVGSVVVEDTMEVAGVNDRAQLAVAEAELRDRINERWMRRGVTMWDPVTTYIDVDVTLPPMSSCFRGDPAGRLRGGEHAELGPDTRLVDTTVGEGAVVTSSVCRRSVIGAEARVGPFAVLGEGPRSPPAARSARRHLTPAPRRGSVRAWNSPSPPSRPGVGPLPSGAGQEIAAQLGVELGEANLREFANGEIHCRFDSSIRGSDVFIVQTHCGPVNDSLMEHLIMIDAAKRASAKRITAVCPTTGTRARTARRPAASRSRPSWWPTCCRWPGDRVISVDLHSGQIQASSTSPSTT